jgi:lysosomal acid phosphatase
MDFQTNQRIYDTLTVDRYLGRPWPSNFSESDYANMRHLHLWFNFLKFDFDLAKALNTNPLKRIMADFDDRISNPNKALKWTFISCHDTDITSMLQGLNISNAQCIEDLYRKGKTTALNCDPNQEYASSIIFELHSTDAKTFYVRVRHDGNYVNLCEKKDVQCEYQQWRSRMQKRIVDANKICEGTAGIAT